MSERATLEELLEFANAVREAGGGNPLDALMPAVPMDPNRCLIARNLNFNCAVGGPPRGEYGSQPVSGDWYMTVDNKEIRDRIAKRLDLPILDGVAYPSFFGKEDNPEDARIPVYAVELPAKIGRVAEEFDNWNSAIDYETGAPILYEDPEAIERLRDFAPYIDASVKEVQNIGIFNDKGELIL